jgi:hypothetical protein
VLDEHVDAEVKIGGALEPAPVAGREQVAPGHGVLAEPDRNAEEVVGVADSLIETHPVERGDGVPLVEGADLDSLVQGVEGDRETVARVCAVLC